MKTNGMDSIFQRRGVLNGRGVAKVGKQIYPEPKDDIEEHSHIEHSDPVQNQKDKKQKEKDLKTLENKHNKERR